VGKSDGISPDKKPYQYINFFFLFIAIILYFLILTLYVI
jgi:hypothetical protein